MRTFHEWMTKGLYLPKIMRDFHDQKALFKTIHSLVDPNRTEIQEIDWIQAQCYVIDIFLWFMAVRGYTLQKSRSKYPFKDIEADLEKVQAHSREAFAIHLDRSIECNQLETDNP